MLSNSCRYAIRAVVYLASKPLLNGKTGIKKISSDLELPSPFLAKILMQLAKYKILDSSKGPHGGFSLLKNPKKISLLDIVNIIDGYDVFTNCVMHSGSCEGVKKDKKHCPLHDDYEKTRKDIVELFKNRTIYQLVKKADNTELIFI